MVSQVLQIVALWCIASFTPTCGAQPSLTGMVPKFEDSLCPDNLVCGDWLATSLASGDCSRPDSVGGYRVTGLQADFQQIFKNDNPTGTTVHWTEHWSIGYSKTDSETVTNMWSAEVGVSLKGITASAGWSQTTEYYDGSTWSVEVDQTMEVDVPPGTSVDLEHRILQVHLTSEKCCKSGTCVEPIDDKTLEFTLPIMGSTKKIRCRCTGPGSLTNPSVVVGTNCYTAALDPDTRNADCPFYTKDLINQTTGNSSVMV